MGSRIATSQQDASGGQSSGVVSGVRTSAAPQTNIAKYGNMFSFSKHLGLIVVRTTTLISH